jgi:putative PIN family toxin of toxin-antitoxin system
MRLVLDTNVVVSALLWRGRPANLLECGTRQNIVFFSSAPLLAELADVLSRSKLEHRIAASGLSVSQLVRLYAGLAALVQPRSVSGVAPDPDDDVVIGTALAAKADFIVTGDAAFRSLSHHEGIRIVSAVEALELITAG